MAQHNDLGNKGEKLAVDFLIANGYTILEKNYRFQKAEIDIIAQKKDVLAVVEVKTRSTDYFGNPQDFVNKKKIELLLKAINHYVDQKDLDLEIRFDIIAILIKGATTNIEHIEEAFYYF
jgi:putative endonuclease